MSCGDRLVPSELKVTNRPFAETSGVLPERVPLAAVPVALAETRVTLPVTRSFAYTWVPPGLGDTRFVDVEVKTRMRPLAESAPLLATPAFDTVPVDEVSRTRTEEEAAPAGGDTTPRATTETPTANTTDTRRKDTTDSPRRVP